MAEDIGGLFDSDPGFLEELASGTEESAQQQQPQTGIPGMMPQNAGPMQQNVRVVQPGYGNMTTMQNGNYGNMQFQNQHQQPPQQYNQSNLNQFNNQPMFNQNPIVSQDPSQTHMNPMMSQPAQVVGNQFQNQSQGMMSQNQVLFQYNTASIGGVNPNRPQLPNPAQQQQMKMQQMGWSQQSQPMFGQQPQSQQQSHQTPYLSQHDYAIPNTASQQIHLQQAQPAQQQAFPNPKNPSQTIYIQNMTPPNRMPNVSQAGGMGMPQQIYQSGTQPYPNMSQGNVANMSAMTTESRMMHQQQQQPFNPQQNAGQFQQFQYQSPPQGVADGSGIKQANQQQSNMMRFQQTSPTQQSAQHRMQFNSIGQQRANAPILSPRPTPPPPSPSVTPGMLSPTGSTSSQQGFAIEKSQQLGNNPGMFQQSANTSDTIIKEQAFSQVQLSQNGPPVMSSSGNKLNAVSIGNMVSVSASLANNQVPQEQISPGYKVLSPPNTGISNPQAINAEIQTLNQQIKQLYSVPQTPQTQQKMLDLQEKLRMVKSQQIIQNQRGKITFQSSVPQVQSMHPASMQNKQPAQGAVLSNNTQVQSTTKPGSNIQLVQSGANNTTGAHLFIIQPQQQSQMSPQNSNTVQVQAPAGQQPAQTVLTLVPSSSSLPQPGQAQPTMGTGQVKQTQHIVINTNHANGSKKIVLHSSGPIHSMSGGEPVKTESGTNQKQEKANKIIAEAIAKAQKSGNTAIPRLIEPPELPATLTSVDDIPKSEVENKTKKRKRSRKEKDKGEQSEKEQQTPKKKRNRKKKKEETPAEPAKADVEHTDLGQNDYVPEVDADGSPKEKKSKKPKKPIGRPPKEKKKKSLPPATFLKNRKRKRRGSSDGSDVEMKVTPPPSPENEDLKRRSGRVKRKKYLDDVDLNLSEEEQLDVTTRDSEGPIIKPENPAEEDAVVVDKILGARMRKKDADVDGEDDGEEEAEEYYVKYKNFSYLHCEWRTEAEIKDKRIQSKIRRYKMKKLQNTTYFEDDEELFNPDYVEVDRVLEESHTIDPSSKEEVTHYLVKWRSLPYEDSTWELQQDVDPEKVKVFKKFNKLPAYIERKYKARPKASEWMALAETHTYKGGNTLREYQLEGVNWLTFNWYKGQNCILADEMGLGKTIQSIAFLQEVFTYGVRGPFLVIAPLSTIANWQREFETWTDMNAVTYHGTSPSRYMLQEYEMYYRDEEGGKITDYYKFHALITTYEIILTDLDLLRSIDWRVIIIDEAHRLKNKNCSLIKCLRCFDFEHKVLLSGTPLQNNVEELFSLLNFLEPAQFSSSEAFMVEFGTLKTEEQVDKLKAILKPMMLRRLKEDVEKNLAAKEETIIEVELTNIQKKYYRAILERNFSFLCKGTSTGGNVPNLMNTMMELRKCCNHPYLINGAEENILSELRVRDGREPEHIEALIQASGKFVLLDKLLPKLKQNGNRVLIFSQMIRVLDIIEDYLINKRYLYERLDGRIRGNLRQEAIDRFSKIDSDRFVFLICTKAGGLGINLTAADTVIIYDSDWNPQNDLQAQARCHRIGQNKMVKVYRLITRNSYEREMFDRASMKLGLDKAVLQSMGGEKIQPQAQLSKREIEDLLRKGAYGALMEDDSAGDKFCEEDIDQILKGRTQVIQIESEGKGSTFAKASFSVTGNRDDIDINDPEFWQKWAKKAEVDTENLGMAELIVDEPRVRKKTARYGNNDGIVDMSDLGSESESDEDGSKKTGRKGRRSRRGGDEDDDFERERKPKPSTTGFGRSELFKVEKGLLHYGWGRWKDILAHSRFKCHMDEEDIEKCGKAILLYGLQYYKGDERIKEFISDLITQSKDGTLKKHSGLSAPVPRGRKGKKAKSEESHFDANKEIEKLGIKIDRDILVNKNAYKRHIHRHSNKVLLRVRMLYYLKHEVLGHVIDQVDQGIHVKDIKNLADPVGEGELPAYWWDEVADKSLLIGVYKHGYEKYNMMRQDAQLIFLSRCGPPDDTALAAELKDDDDNENDDLDDKIDSSILDKDDEDESLTCASDAVSTPKRGSAMAPEEVGEEGKLPFPTASEMNTRLRKIITHYQRDFKKQQIKMQQQAKKMEKRGKLDAMFKEREARKRETLQKWTRREETDFYRVVSTYGIEFDRVKGRYIWDKFRVMAKLEKKTDEQLTEYFISFYHMCLRVCRKIKEEAYPPTPIYIEAITEERASRCIARIDLLSKIREEIVVHQKMDQRVHLCKMSHDLPSWWICGKHDKELLVGAAKHGLARTEFYILNDPSLSFMDTVKSLKAATDSHSNSPANFKMFGKDLEKKEVKTEEDDPESKPEKEEEEEEEEDEGDEDDTMNRAKLKAELKKEKEIKEKAVKQEKGEEEMEKTEKTSSIKSEDINEDSCDTVINEDVKNEISSPKIKTENGVEQTETEEIEESELLEKVKSETNTSSEKSIKKEERAEDDRNASEVSATVKSEDIEDSDKVCDGEGADLTEVVKDKKFKDEIDIKDDPDEEVRRTMEDEESEMDLLTGVSQSLYTDWPKDRVVFHRLEQVCFCVETGEWPFPAKMKNMHILGIDSGSNTPTRSLTPLTPKHDEEGSGKDEKKKDKDFEVQVRQGDNLKMTFQRKPEKGKSEMTEAEKNARIQAILAQSLAASQASSDDSQSDSILSSQSLSDSPFLNGSPMTEEELMLGRRMLEQGLYCPDRRGRRGRKRKEEKMAEIAMAEALARRQTARALASIEPDAHVPVINLEDGSRLSGDEAPRKKDIDSWMDKHPGYIIDSRDDEIEEGEIVPDYKEQRKGRKPKFDPAFLEVDKLTGEENVSVINRLTGKKITGAKAPPLRYLADWLEQNAMWDVDPKWADLVRAKGTLPKTLLPRVMTPSRRGRRPRDSPISHSSILGGGDPHQAAALAASIEAMNAAQLMAAGYGKLPLPFGSLPGLGMNPMMGLIGFPGVAPGPIPTDKLESKSKEPSKKSSDEGEKKQKKDDEALPHSSFPLMFNPMLYNQALLASHGLSNFPTPTSLSGLGSSMINGHSKSEKDSGKSPKSQHKDRHDQSGAEDLSCKPKPKKVIENTTAAHSGSKNKSKVETVTAAEGDDDMPCDLSMKPKSKDVKDDKSKQKICNSDKLSRIVDTLKCRVNNMDDIPIKEDKVRDIRRNSVDSVLKASEAAPTIESVHSESSLSKIDSSNLLSHKPTQSVSPNHLKEPVPKIVQELLLAKQHKELKEREELLKAKQKKLDNLLNKQNQHSKEAMLSSATLMAESAFSAQGSSDEEIEDNLNEPMEEDDS